MLRCTIHVGFYPTGRMFGPYTTRQGLLQAAFFTLVCVFHVGVKKRGVRRLLPTGCTKIVHVTKVTKVTKLTRTPQAHNLRYINMLAHFWFLWFQSPNPMFYNAFFRNQFGYEFGSFGYVVRKQQRARRPVAIPPHPISFPTIPLSQ